MFLFSWRCGDAAVTSCHGLILWCAGVLVSWPCGLLTSYGANNWNAQTKRVTMWTVQTCARQNRRNFETASCLHWARPILQPSTSTSNRGNGKNAEISFKSLTFGSTCSHKLEQSNEVFHRRCGIMRVSWGCGYSIGGPNVCD